MLQGETRVRNGEYVIGKWGGGTRSQAWKRGVLRAEKVKWN